MNARAFKTAFLVMGLLIIVGNRAVAEVSAHDLLYANGGTNRYQAAPQNDLRQGLESLAADRLRLFLNAKVPLIFADARLSNSFVAALQGRTWLPEQSLTVIRSMRLSDAALNSLLLAIRRAMDTEVGLNANASAELQRLRQRSMVLRQTIDRDKSGAVVPGFRRDLDLFDSGLANVRTLSDLTDSQVEIAGIEQRVTGAIRFATNPSSVGPTIDPSVPHGRPLPTRHYWYGRPHQRYYPYRHRARCY